MAPHETTKLEAALEAARARYDERNPNSKALYEESLESLPGGNTRTVLYSTPFPLFMQRGEGYKLWDEDGHEYADFVGDLTAGLFGHSHPLLLETLAEKSKSVGLSLGATHSQEFKYAELLCQRFQLEMIRFCSSGTEANLHALAVARKYTGRRKVIVFKGGYHGSVLTFGTDISDGNSELQLGPAENNVDKDDFILLQYNDIQAVRDTFSSSGGKNIAAVLVEGMQGSGGFIGGTNEFMWTIQEECTKNGAVFILDEVMTSRLGPRGLKSLFPSDKPLTPHLATFGKYLGGGMPFGAFGGSKEIMATYDPRVPSSLGHSGTFQNNPLMLHMGHVALSGLYTKQRAVEHSLAGDKFRRSLQEATKGTKICFRGKGSLLFFHVSETWGKSQLHGASPITNKEQGGYENEDLKALFWLEMLEAGFWLHTRGGIALILDTPTEVLGQFVTAVKKFIERHVEIVKLD